MNSNRKLNVMKDHVEQLNSHSESQLQDLHDKFVRFVDDEKKKEFEVKHGKEYKELLMLSKKEREEMDKIRDYEKLFLSFYPSLL